MASNVHSCMCVSVYGCVFMCVCVCACVLLPHARIHTHANTHTHRQVVFLLEATELASALPLLLVEDVKAVGIQPIG